MKFLKDLLDAECTYRLPDDVMWRFIGLMTREEVRKGGTVIDEGRVNPDIYIVADGIFSYNYLNGTDERCHAFALPGAMMWSALPIHIMPENRWSTLIRRVATR